MRPAMDSTLTEAERIEEAAATWFFKRDSEAWTHDDQAQLDAWLNSSTAHRVAFLRLNAGWKRTARLKALGAGVPPGVIPPPGSWGDVRFPGGREFSSYPLSRLRERAGVRVLPWSIAATVLLSVGVVFYAYNAGILQGSRYSTPIGGLDTVPLKDGSQVILNTDTRIRVDLTDKERLIELDKGEAFFDVAKDSTRPFVVQAGNKRVIAVGTKFSVRRIGNDIRVTVIEGKVRIDRPDAHAAPLLKAGGVAQTADSETLVREGAPTEAEQLLSWRSGYLVFEATPLAEAVAEFNRYNARKIVIEDPATATLRIGGNFRSNNTDAFLWLLQSGFPIRIEHHSDRIVLTSQ